MGLTSLQVCMDSSDWLQGTMNEESGMDSSSLSGDMLSCSRPLTERRLRPQHDQALKCPRCESTHTKFCYYNNYSLTQPRYFCKTCRRYWTKGGTLRNIPVGGGCRKNKKAASTTTAANKKSNNDTPQPITHHHPLHHTGSSSSPHNPTDLHLSFPDHQVQFSHFNPLLGTHIGTMGMGMGIGNPSFMETKYSIGNAMLDNPNPRPIDFMESGKNNYDHNYHGMINGLGMGGDQMTSLSPNFHNLCSPYGLSLEGNGTGTSYMDTCQRMMIPYDDNEGNEDENGMMDVKPNTKVLALEWQEQQSCSEKVDSYGYLNGMGMGIGMGMGMGSSWNGMVNGSYGPSSTNPLV